MVDVEQRRYPRANPPKGLVVAWQCGTERTVSFLENLGLGGMFVVTRKPVALEAMVKILMELPIGEVRARAMVRRIIPQRGMGIEFIAMNQEDRARLGRTLMPLLADNAASQ
jgi:hypothetical protein